MIYEKVMKDPRRMYSLPPGVPGYIDYIIIRGLKCTLNFIVIRLFMHLNLKC